MPKNIKITEKQYKRIQEEIDNDFIYFTDNNTKPYDGQVNISANGKIDGETYANPTTTDKVQQSLTPQGYGRYRSYGNISPRTMREGVELDQSNDFYDMKGVVEEFFDKVGLSGKETYDPNAGKPFLHPGRQANIILSKFRKV